MISSHPYGLGHPLVNGWRACQPYVLIFRCCLLRIQCLTVTDTLQYGNGDVGVFVSEHPKMLCTIHLRIAVRGIPSLISATKVERIDEICKRLNKKSATHREITPIIHKIYFLWNGHSITTFHGFTITSITKGGCKITFYLNFPIYLLYGLHVMSSANPLIFFVVNLQRRPKG